MANLEWSDEIYSLGIKKIDDQHKQLIQLISGLARNQDNPDREFVQKILNTLVQYTQKHFNDEERIIRRMHFPHFESHHQQHLRFIASVKDSIHSMNASESPEIVLRKITEFLGNWVIHHILVEDKAYADYLLS